VMTLEELEMIADLCRKHDVIVVSDEVYEWLVYPPNQHIRIGMHAILYVLFAIVCFVVRY